MTKPRSFSTFSIRLLDGTFAEVPTDWIDGIFPKGTFKIRRFKARFIA
jgi:hypothetical protein